METNGHSSTPFATLEHEIRNIRSLAGAESTRSPAPARLSPPTEPAAAPVELHRSPAERDQETHDLMHKTVDTICDEWVRQLQQVRHNSERIEQRVLERAAIIKGDITQLYKLGDIATEAARHGDEVNQRLLRELEILEKTA
jgi:hypothetical protein